MFQGVVYIYTVVQCTPTEKERKLFCLEVWQKGVYLLIMMIKKNLSWKYFDEILSQLVVKQSEWKNIYFLRENCQTTGKSTTYAHSYYHFCYWTHLKVGIVFNSWHLFSMFWVHFYHLFQKFNLLWFLTNILTHNNRFSWILKPLKKICDIYFRFQVIGKRLGMGNRLF